MKVAVLLVLAVAITATSGATLEKRGLRDYLRNITAIGLDTYSGLLDLATARWRDLKQRVTDYDIRGRFSQIRSNVKARYGDIVNNLNDIVFNKVATAAKDVIKGASDILEVKKIVEKVRLSLGKDADDVTDDQIDDIVQAVEDDIATGDSDVNIDADLDKRGFRDYIRNKTYSLYAKAKEGWNKLKQKMRDYDIRGKLSTIKQKLKEKFGDVADDLGDVIISNIVEAAKVAIEDSSDILAVGDITDLIRSSLGSVVDAVSDDLLGDIVQVLEDDVSSDN
ncbi:hypothetical protein EGW08_014692 [Elysia chlorotica]|uniref:Uncharacterized protein n=1 Tax=Elysia chlorotica TaxID=188477 RepID=A0A433T7P3_ELYCH|nr:hypothetical protein EGW08_014692 [Elysia chlorotica]